MIIDNEKPLTETRVHYEEQSYYAVHGKRKKWDCSLEYPADIFTLDEIVKKVRCQRKLNDKPMRVVKVTVTTEVIETFK